MLAVNLRVEVHLGIEIGVEIRREEKRTLRSAAIVEESQRCPSLGTLLCRSSSDRRTFHSSTQVATRARSDQPLPLEEVSPQTLFAETKRQIQIGERAETFEL